MAAVLAKEDASEKWAAAWWSLQQLRPDAYKGKQTGETTKRADVDGYRWLAIDVDRAEQHSVAQRDAGRKGATAYRCKKGDDLAGRVRRA